MYKKGFSFKNVAVLLVCLVVAGMFAACGKDDGKNSGKNNGGGTVGVDDKWPSAATLTKYGLSGISKPAGFSGGYYVETVGISISIYFNGNASTAASVKGYFANSSNGWSIVQEYVVDDAVYNLYEKESGGTTYVANFYEMEGYSFYLQAAKDVN